MKYNQRVLILGSSGYLGRTVTILLQRQCRVFPTYHQHSLFSQAQKFDFWTDDIAPLLKQHQIDVVIMAANVAYVAADPSFDKALFCHQTEKFLQACKQCRVLYLSSDAIFDGKKGMYTETDVPTPTTLYGKNHKFFEDRLRTACPDYCIIRPSYLYGYSLAQLDHRLSQTRAALLAKRQCEFFSDMIKSPLEVTQAAMAVTMLTFLRYIGVVHIGGPSMSVYEFYYDAMTALGVPTTHLFPVSMPVDSPLLKNTSLDVQLMKKLTGIKPLSVKGALA